MIQSIDLSGFKHLRFSRAGLLELVKGLEVLPCVRAVSLKNNGICQDHEKEVLSLFHVSKVRAIDLSFNNINSKLAGGIGKKLRDEVSHIQWIDLT